MPASTPRNTDTYYTISTASTGEYREKGSRFLAFAWPVEQENEIQELLAAIKSKYHDARHHCYAWKLGADGKQSRQNDDGEPSGTAGKPIMGQIQSFGVTNVLVVVVRYFGGILLGTGGLAVAYRQAARDALSNAGIAERTLGEELEIQFGYDHTREVQRILKEQAIRITHESYGESCLFRVFVPRSGIAQLTNRLSRIEKLKIIQSDHVHSKNQT